MHDIHKSDTKQNIHNSDKNNIYTYYTKQNIQ